jgi:CRP-like cAMP-binding protein
VLTEIEKATVAQLLRGASAFQGMPENIALRLAALMRMREFQPDHFLTQENQPNEGDLMILVSGEAEISSSHAASGGHLVHRVAKPGHVIGEVGFIDSQAHSATCMALVFTKVAVLSRDQFIHLFQTDVLSAAQLMAGLLRLMARRIRHANRHMLAQDQLILQLQTELLSMQKATPLRPR